MSATFPPSSNILIAYGCVFAVLMAGTSVTRYLAYLFPNRDYTELRLRVRTWWLIVPLLLAALSLGPVAVSALFVLVSGLALGEYLNLTVGRDIPQPVVGLAYLAIPAQHALAFKAADWAFFAFVPLCCVMFSAAIVASGKGGRLPLRTAGFFSFGLILSVFNLSHISRLDAFDENRQLVDGTGLVIFLLMVTQMNDVAQYVWGKILGKTPLAPTLSPRKTREGMLGGLVTSAILAALIGPLLTPLDVVTSTACGVALAIAGVAGDLTVSAIKRKAGVKDAGNLLPGHGGLLDRVDSLIYAAPLFYFGMVAWR